MINFDSGWLIFSLYPKWILIFIWPGRLGRNVARSRHQPRYRCTNIVQVDTHHPSLFLTICAHLLGHAPTFARLRSYGQLSPRSLLACFMAQNVRRTVMCMLGRTDHKV